MILPVPGTKYPVDTRTYRELCRRCYPGIVNYQYNLKPRQHVWPKYVALRVDLFSGTFVIPVVFRHRFCQTHTHNYVASDTHKNSTIPVIHFRQLNYDTYVFRLNGTNCILIHAIIENQVVDEPAVSTIPVVWIRARQHVNSSKDPLCRWLNISFVTDYQFIYHT